MVFWWFPQAYLMVVITGLSGGIHGNIWLYQKWYLAVSIEISGVINSVMRQYPQVFLLLYLYDYLATSIGLIASVHWVIWRYFFTVEVVCIGYQLSRVTIQISTVF